MSHGESSWGQLTVVRSSGFKRASVIFDTDSGGMSEPRSNALPFSFSDLRESSLRARFPGLFARSDLKLMLSVVKDWPEADFVDLGIEREDREDSDRLRGLVDVACSEEEASDA